MRIVVYGRISPGAPDTREAIFYRGLKGTSHHTTHSPAKFFRPTEADRRLDLVVVHGEHQYNGVVARTYRDLNIPVLVVDLPPLRFLKDSSEWTGVFPGRVGRLQDTPTSALRWETLPKDISKVPCRPPTGNHVLILGQLPKDKSHGLDATGYWSWVRRRIQNWASYGLAIRFRPHPKMLPQEMPDDVAAYRDIHTVLDDALRDCLFADTLCSSAEYDALARGVPCLRDGDREPKLRIERLHVAARHTWHQTELLHSMDQVLDSVLEKEKAWR